MTREQEDRILQEREALRQRESKLIQRIVDARLKGDKDAEAIQRLSDLSQQHMALAGQTR